MLLHSHTVTVIDFDLSNLTKFDHVNVKNRMTDPIVRLSNSIFQESDLFYAFRFIEWCMNEIFPNIRSTVCDS